MDDLYQEEQSLLRRLLNSQSKEQYEAIKRTINRVNKEMKSLDI